MRRKAIIVSIKGKNLSFQEKILLSKEKPWGIILFKRNIDSFKQVQKLVNEIKKCTKEKNFPILIDEEGATVSRLSKIIKNNIDANFFGKIFKFDKNISISLYNHYLKSTCKILNNLGINTNSIPVLDVIRKSTNKIIGPRSFSKDKKIVKILGEETIKICHAQKIVTIVKHIPGHGCATADSHLKMPKVHLSEKELNEIDFYPFKKTKAKLAMTAHILYSKIDAHNVCTFSKKIIKNIIRKKIGFRGILISDDISMRALKYDLITNAKKSFLAGCNLVLYCAGNIQDNFKLIKSVPYIDKFTLKKTSEIYKILR